MIKIYIKTFFKYLFWGMTPDLPILSSAIIQQGIAMLPIFLYGHYGLFFSIVIFSVVFHFRNWPLVIVTAFFAGSLYSMFVFMNMPVYIIPILHAGFGTALYYNNFNLSTWR